MYSPNSAIAQYQRVNNVGSVEGASPHQLILMLMNGALERLGKARGAIERHDAALKGGQLGKAINIIGGLQGSLDRNQAPEFAENMDRLYDYMQRRLLEANIKNDISIIDEVSDLMRNVKTTWEEIDPVRKTAY
ncbi:flagellar export chaperone FliS [Pseudohongiella sp. SYSU M77423]|jgi:flagellar secretion chaperone FliS|uniref:flagellar export chaperone FliS n=1 Tax=unclassified Pseudohongiella TaxID=2629611 RepID=UPI000C52ACEC|nr:MULTISPECIES: flagellar export chaperone FliS [unclassified Pseudohongiella]MAO39154.1 flagellar export chaperone FliS [Pseudohongiella sp.]MAY56053.1 flagellar export chaperone FliS [Gammaproteobacteria bacterium]MEC8860900.1 flagellar export chaperone FliS [Pseudomonadota bacterium]MBJ54881.1 flagellar export chaperone FliS [Gammaproteobacteria bacterium]MDH7944890.1 flagellar export chaperone FliS [Pseudohongiella sp. SYSU M77423]|tara:strand:+ start:225 stop:626 length:402 start_codon:yes stop_codon:yes gene_type:complete